VPTTPLSYALKEWHLVIQALLQGQQFVILRKGGILESAGEFELEHESFALFPTLLHQSPQQVKPAWQDQVTTQSQEPARITLRAWAQAEAIWAVPDRARMERLEDLHIWAAPLLDMRFSYRPEKPLYLVLLRTYELVRPVELANTPAYAGCKSWVPLETPLDITGSKPIVHDEQLHTLRTRIDQAFG
jgi:hypothetical protein